MRFLNIKILALILLSSMGSTVFAYNWGFSNFTSKTIDLRFGAMGAAGWWYNTVQPGDKTVFSLGGWWAGYCMWGVQWKEKGQGDDKYQTAEIVYLPVELYDKTVKNAAKIGSGFDQFLCTAVALIKVVNKGECPSMFSALINWIGGLVARSSCANREFTVFQDDKGEVIFTTLLH